MVSTGDSAGEITGTSMASTTIDHLHPLYLHPYDSPGSLNIEIMLTGTDNYTLWSKAMQLALLGKNKVGFIDGTYTTQDSKIFGINMIASCHHQFARSQIMLMHQLPSINQVYAMISQDESQKLAANLSRSMPESLNPTAMYTSRSNSRNKKPYNPNAFCDYCHMKVHMRSDCSKLLKCDHCHKTGHVKLDCFKLIGYPSEFKGKRDTVVAGNSTYEESFIHQHAPQPTQKEFHPAAESGMMPMPMFTPQQHQKLIQMLNKTTVGDTQSVANMAGNSYLFKDDSLQWVVDTGATHHMINDAKYLHCERLIENAGSVQLPTGDSTKRKQDKIMIVLIYVDDLLLTGNDQAMIQQTKERLQQAFKIKDLGELRYFLGLEFARNNAGILIHQRKYALELISDMGLAGAKPVSTPMELNQKLTTVEFDASISSRCPDETLKDPTGYQRLIGRLLYLTTTRPDISFVVQCLSQFMHSPKTSHMEAAMRLVRYVKSEPGLGILMASTGGNDLQVFCDADWGAYINSRRSITGYLVQYGGSPISWKSKKQVTVSRSSVEAEYRAMASTVAEIFWIVGLFDELGIKINLHFNEEIFSLSIVLHSLCVILRSNRALAMDSC
uniref:Reverse transcriptase Ty1/copia-type domain-containing protein n=1 Tax=Solanum lycopersicum TaxID=4081 RepID=A0A3Q7HPE8_SOLLC